MSKKRTVLTKLKLRSEPAPSQTGLTQYAPRIAASESRNNSSLRNSATFRALLTSPIKCPALEMHKFVRVHDQMTTWFPSAPPLEGEAPENGMSDVLQPSLVPGCGVRQGPCKH